MNKIPFQKEVRLSWLIALLVCAVAISIPNSPLYAGLWDQIRQQFLLSGLMGEGKFVGYQRNVDTKDPLFPFEVINDGFKMIRVYQDFPGNYMVEWTWRALLKNRSAREWEITFEYKLQDEDALLVASSKEHFRKISVGETVLIEKTDQLPYDTAKRVMNSNWFIHLQN